MLGRQHHGFAVSIDWRGGSVGREHEIYHGVVYGVVSLIGNYLPANSPSDRSLWVIKLCERETNVDQRRRHAPLCFVRITYDRCGKERMVKQSGRRGRLC